MGKGGDSIVVAVRVRPFNDREKNRNAKLVIDMPDDKRTCIRDSNNPDDAKWFTFDYSYWSHDGYKTEKSGYLTPADSHYADQKRVFDDLGKGVLENAWAGYNCSLFAYGQTGSGKSYSIVGFKGNKGIVPIVCEELFKKIEEKRNGKKKDSQYEVFISMFEIYCEKIRDLLTTKEPPKGGLKVREHPKTGFYVENLTTVPVNSYKEIEARIDEGTKNRTIAATNMNATSSRAHTIVKIQFNQKLPKSNGAGTTTKKSEINLVDLAGSERQSAAGTEGDRLKEGIVINQSLSTLGRVIKALHESQNNKSGKRVQIPFRDSVLTCLLKNALGGNSKTIMIAAISPADINYEETLSTLRFADRAKAIKTNAVVNENQTERMIRELKEENERLQKMIKGGGKSGTDEELENLRRQLEENQREMANLEKTWQQKVAEEASKHNMGGDRAEIERRKKNEPYLWNLNEDAALSGLIVHFIPQGEVTVGNNSSHPTIVLNGLSILPLHAAFVNSKNDKITLTPLNGAEILINGRSINKETDLQQNDRILFGGNHLYVFQNPNKKGIRNDTSYEMAQKEIAEHAGISLSTNGGQKSKADLILEEELISTMPLVYRANAMAKELQRPVSFEIVLVSPEMRGLTDGLTEIWIKVHNVREDTYFLWEKARFMNRYYGMQEMYELKLDGEDWNLSKERDPFYEPPDSPVFIGSAVVFLQSLAYLIESEEAFPIVDFSGNELGQLSVTLSPCSGSGKEIHGEYVEDPRQLVGKSLAFKVRIIAAVGLPRRILKSCCKYHFFGSKEISTSTVTGNSPSYAHEKLFTYKNVSKELVNYLQSSNLYITLWGTQKPRESRRGGSPIGSAPTKPLRSENGKSSMKKKRSTSRPKNGGTNGKGTKRSI
ncbi:hypothetical protein WR25_26093 [Diploscapter pachys]|uniref:Kinesin-like protein n=1 Tax=Diploscapter pachys TaxID=2018661 RepID=A0A2A2J5X1_9BILA|nr:hypothetical protein WR25_26093 [Diploscapter pachys]